MKAWGLRSIQMAKAAGIEGDGEVEIRGRGAVVKPVEEGEAQVASV